MQKRPTIPPRTRKTRRKFTPEEMGELPPTLDELLEQEPSEELETFLLRENYTLLLDRLSDPIGAINPKGKIVLGHMMIKKARYGVTYDSQSEKILQHANDQIVTLLQK